jgi:hypothetical protein
MTATPDPLRLPGDKGGALLLATRASCPLGLGGVGAPGRLAAAARAPAGAGLCIAPGWAATTTREGTTLQATQESTSVHTRQAENIDAGLQVNN